MRVGNSAAHIALNRKSSGKAGTQDSSKLNTKEVSQKEKRKSFLETYSVKNHKDRFSGKDKNKSELDENDFINLLCHQIKNQNPMDPQDPSQMLSQMAQFSNLKETRENNKQLKEMKKGIDTQQALMMQGKKVTFSKDQESFTENVRGVDFTSDGPLLLFDRGRQSTMSEVRSLYAVEEILNSEIDPETQQEINIARQEIAKLVKESIKKSVIQNGVTKIQLATGISVTENEAAKIVEQASHEFIAASKKNDQGGEDRVFISREDGTELSPLKMLQTMFR